MAKRQLLAAAILCAIPLGGCTPVPSVFNCATNADCLRSAETGAVCEPTAYCAFPATGCPSGLRYDPSAGALADSCVAEKPDAGTPDLKTVLCSTGQTSCAGVCIDTESDRDNCGACNKVCPTGQVCLSAVCDLTPPRPVAPPSFSFTTSKEPVFRWQLASGTDGARLVICRERACSGMVTSIDAVGTSVTLGAPLPPGTLFWRLQGEQGGHAGTSLSPTWELTVGKQSAPKATAWATAPDVNGDGFADAVGGTLGGSAAYVYLGGPAGLASSPLVLRSPAGADFGRTVASLGDTTGSGYGDLAIGAPVTGAVYVYAGGAMGPGSSPIALAGSATAKFGAAIAAAGDVNGDGFADLLVGAPGADEASLYLGSATGIVKTAASSLSTGAAGFGSTVSGGSDVNGDGYADLLIGAPGVEAALYLGGSGGVSPSPSVTLAAPAGVSDYASAVVLAGDVNGDGFADAVIGAAGSNAIYFYAGSSAGLASGVLIDGPSGTTGFGTLVAPAGDVNGDGFGDFVVGATGAAYLVLGGSSGPRTAPIVLSEPAGATGFGNALDGAGDVDGDGYPDVLVGAAAVGEIVLFPGSSSGIGASSVLAGPSGAPYFGWSLASLGAGLRHEQRDLPL